MGRRVAAGCCERHIFLLCHQCQRAQPRICAAPGFRGALLSRVGTDSPTEGPPPCWLWGFQGSSPHRARKLSSLSHFHRTYSVQKGPAFATIQSQSSKVKSKPQRTRWDSGTSKAWQGPNQTLAKPQRWQKLSQKKKGATLRSVAPGSPFGRPHGTERHFKKTGVALTGAGWPGTRG